MTLLKSYFGDPSGETNTASSIGTGSSISAGTKTGVDIELNSIKSENSLLSVSLDEASHDVELTVNVGNIDHGGLAGISDDDHALYLLASAATNRSTFATNWTDLTDGGATTLHSHAGGSDPWTYVKLASDFTSSLAANTSVTNFYFTPSASNIYVVEGCFLLRTATATVGARPGVSWPAGYSDGAAWVGAPNSYTAFRSRFIPAGTTANAASTGLASTTASHLGQLWATLVMGASPSGNFQITLATETAGTNVTMRAGSWIRYRII